MGKLKTAVIGVGYLGAFHADKLAALPSSELIAVVDIDAHKAQRKATQLGVQAETDYRALIGKIDAATVVVPTQSHYQVAKDLLSHGVHILLEKPMTTTLEQAQALIDLAQQHRCVLQVGHLERFNPALLALDEIIEQPLFIEAHRLAAFRPRGTDVSVVLDLMIHDIDIILHLIQSPVQHIDASGLPVLSRDIDIANSRLQFSNGCVANVTASRVSQKSERKMRLFQHNAYIAVDFQNSAVSVYRKGQGEMYPGIADIEQHTLHIPKTDALDAEIAAFLRAIQTHTPPLVSGLDGKQALATAIEINRLLGNHS